MSTTVLVFGRSKGVTDVMNLALPNTGEIDGKTVFEGIDTQALEAQAETLRGVGATVVNIAVDGKLAGILAIADPIKASTPDALKALAAEGIKVIMLTGDNRTTATAVAKRLGISEVEAEVLPDQKSAVVTKLQQEGRVVAMAGDGVSDAPALAAADFGIAMGPERTSRWRAPA